MAAPAVVAEDEAQLMDTRVWKPRNWDGDRKKWPIWKMNVQGYVGSVDPRLRQMMDLALTFDRKITNADIIDD